MAKYTADRILIVSIWPGELEPRPLSHGLDPDPRSGRSTRYWIEPVKRYSRPPFRTLEVYDAFENVPDLNELSRETYSGHNKMTSKPVLCEHISENLVRYWAGNRVGVPAGASPGIMALAKGQDIPHQKDLDNLTAKQTAFAEFNFSQGSRLFNDKKWGQITADMKLMALWLGRECAWANPEITADMVKCPFCTQQIAPDASFCFHCRNQVKKLTPELAKLAGVEATA